MGACCKICSGSGIEKYPDGRNMVHQLCPYCGGSGGWNEIDVRHGSPLAKALMEAAAKRAASK